MICKLLLSCKYSFQELDLSVEALLVNVNVKELKWTAAVLRALGDKADNYWKVCELLIKLNLFYAN
jgi:hypothetical protein